MICYQPWKLLTLCCGFFVPIPGDYTHLFMYCRRSHKGEFFFQSCDGFFFRIPNLYLFFKYCGRSHKGKCLLLIMLKKLYDVVVYLFSLYFFWVTLPSAVQLLICAPTNGGKSKQKRV